MTRPVVYFIFIKWKDHLFQQNTMKRFSSFSKEVTKTHYSQDGRQLSLLPRSHVAAAKPCACGVAESEGTRGAIRSVIGGRGTEGKVGRGLQSYIFSEAAASHMVHDHGNGLMGWPCRNVRVLAHSGRATRLHFASVAAAWLLGVVDSSPSPSLPGQVPSRRLTFPGWRWHLPVVVLSLQRLDSQAP